MFFAATKQLAQQAVSLLGMVGGGLMSLAGSIGNGTSGSSRAGSSAAEAAAGTAAGNSTAASAGGAPIPAPPAAPPTPTTLPAPALGTDTTNTGPVPTGPTLVHPGENPVSGLPHGQGSKAGVPGVGGGCMEHGTARGLQIRSLFAYDC